MVTLPMHKLAALVGLVLLSGGGNLGCGGASSRPQPVAGEVRTKLPAPVPWRVSEIKDPRVFLGPTGMRFEVVPVESTVDENLDGRFLLRMTGSESDLDGVVLLTWRNGMGSFVASLGGEPVVIIYPETHHTPKGPISGWRYRNHTSAFDRVNLEIGEASEVDTKDLLRRYLRQEELGINQKLAPGDRASRERVQQARLDEYLALKSLQACGPLTMSIDWSTVEDQWFDEFSIAGECTEDLALLNSFCTRFPNRVEQVQVASALRCAYSGSPKDGEYILPTIAKSGGLLFVPRRNRDAGNKTQAYFRKIFGEQAQVLRGKKIYFIARDEPNGERSLYNGDGKTFYPTGRLSENVDFDSKTLEGGTKEVALIREDGDWTLRCGEQREKLEFLVGKEREAILAAAVYEAVPKWQREPYFLARDTRGTYYYVDRFKLQYGGKRYRVFTGRRGQLKLSKLKGVVDDSVGTVFSTDDGELRLVVAQDGRKPAAMWIRGNKKSELTSVSVYTNRSLIYDELGAYFGEDLGFLCAE